MSGPITKMDLGHTEELHLANSKKGLSRTDRTKHLRALTYWVTFKKLALIVPRIGRMVMS